MQQDLQHMLRATRHLLLADTAMLKARARLHLAQELMLKAIMEQLQVKHLTQKAEHAMRLGSTLMQKATQAKLPVSRLMPADKVQASLLAPGHSHMDGKLQRQETIQSRSATRPMLHATRRSLPDMGRLLDLQSSDSRSRLSTPQTASLRLTHFPPTTARQYIHLARLQDKTSHSSASTTATPMSRPSLA